MCVLNPLRLERAGCATTDGVHGALAVRAGSGRKTYEQTERDRGRSAEDVAHRNAPRLADEIEARELERRDDLRAVVVERGGRIGEQETHVLDTSRIATDERRFQRQHRRDRRLAAATHFAEADQAGIAFDSTIVRTKRPNGSRWMAQWRFERNRHVVARTSLIFIVALSLASYDERCPYGSHAENAEFAEIAEKKRPLHGLVLTSLTGGKEIMRHDSVGAARSVISGFVFRRVLCVLRVAVGTLARQ